MFKGIEFTHSAFFWLLLTIPLLIVWHVLKHKQQNADLSVSTLDGLEGKNDFWGRLRHFLFILRMGAIALIVIALARPQTVDVSTKTKTTRGIDIVMAIDVSASMLAKDLKPSRLEALKNVASRFIKRKYCSISQT